jgi:endonuclease/exonuclease/phosphatase family metal-dependent hydrolase
LIGLLTLNTWKDEGDYERRMSLITAQLTPLYCDIICLQEVFSTDDGALSTFDHISGSTGLRGFNSPSRLKHRGGRWSSSGLSILSRWPILAAETIALPFDPLDGERIGQRVDIETPYGPLRVINLHLTHLIGPEAARLRAEQLAVIQRQALIDWSDPIVFAGDFNASPDDGELQALLTLPNIQCSADLNSDPSTMMAGVPKVIDMVVLAGGGKWNLRSAETVLADYDDKGVSPSDHKGIMTVIDAGKGD